MIEAVSQAGSIRKAAPLLNITPSALNRRIRQFEDTFGADIFERLPQGVRLNAAGDVLIHHIRQQVAEYERVKMDVSDLGTLKQGHISIGASTAVMNIFLPAQIARFRAEYPGVTFTVRRCDRAEAEQGLLDYQIDLALMFEPIYLASFERIAEVPQPICAMMARDHPLADMPSVGLADCLKYPHVIPIGQHGVRHLLNQAAGKLNLRLAPVVEAESSEFMRYYVLQEGAVGFQIRLGLKEKDDSKTLIRSIDEKDLSEGSLLFGKLRDRALSVAANTFASRIAAELGPSAEGT